MDRVVTRPAGHRGLERRTGAQHIDLIRPAAAIHLNRLNVGEGDDAPRAGDVFVGHDEYIADRRAHNHDRVHAGAAVDLHRRILEIIVTIEASSTEEGSQVSDLIGVIGILTEHQESLEQEPVIPRTTMEVELGTVMVHLEPVILSLAQHHQGRRIAMCHVLRVGHRHAIRIFQIAIPLVRHERHCADDDLVIATAHIDHREGHGVIGEHAVVPGIGLHEDPLHLLVRGHVSRAGVKIAERDGTGPESTSARRIQRHGIRLVGAVYQEEINAGTLTTVVDIDTHPCGAVEIDDVMLRPRGFVRAVVQCDYAGPRRNRQRAVTHGYRPIHVAEHHRVVPYAARQHRDLEYAAQVFHGGARGIAVAAVRDGQIGVIQPRLGNDGSLCLIDLHRRESEAATVGEDGADNEGVVRERHVLIECLGQRVNATGIHEGIEPETTRDRVVA